MTCKAAPDPAPRPTIRGGMRLVTGLGIGMLPWCPGTWASLAPCTLAALALALRADHRIVQAALAVVAYVFSLATMLWAGRAEKIFGRRDPRAVVSDEIAGQSIALLPAGDPLTVLCAFLAFRLFDILKPWPIRRLERLPGGLGILFDDLAAGLGGVIVVVAVRLIAQR